MGPSSYPGLCETQLTHLDSKSYFRHGSVFRWLPGDGYFRPSRTVGCFWRPRGQQTLAYLFLGYSSDNL